MPIPEKKQKMPDARPTKREIQVLQLIVKGKTSRQIAVELDVSLLTIKTHRQNLLQKMGAANAAQLVMKAGLSGYI